MLLGDRVRLRASGGKKSEDPIYSSKHLFGSVKCSVNFYANHSVFIASSSVLALSSCKRPVRIRKLDANFWIIFDLNTTPLTKPI